MRLSFRVFIAFLGLGFVLAGCGRECDGCPAAVGGDQPTNFIVITDTAFIPADITKVRGNTFTFVNNTGASKGIYSSDSIVIKQPDIANKGFFLFKKDTVGDIVYRLAGNPAVQGVIRLTP